MAEVRYVQATRVYAKDAPPAVDALDLDIKDGEFMVLVGPSGSGKTTALRMLAGLEPLDGGRVEIGEKDVTWVPPKDRDIAMVFQNYALYPSKTVAENMGFALKMQHVPKDERARRVREAAKLLDLDEQAAGPQAQGPVRRAAAARGDGPRHRPRAPGVLDGRAAVQPGRQATGADPQPDRRTAAPPGRYHRLRHPRPGRGDDHGTPGGGAGGGKLQQCDTPRQLYDNPVNQFVAGFIGSPAMNLQTVPLTEGGARLAGTVIPLPTAVRTAASQAGLRELVLGIRPEHLHLADGAGEIKGEVMLVEELGADALLHVRLAESGNQVVARTEGRKPPAPGQDVTFRVQPDDIFAFHPVTGARIGG